MNKVKKYFLISIILLILSVLYTIAVKNVDTAKIGPNGSTVGFSTLNSKVHNTFEFNQTWYKITKYAGILPFFLVAFYGCTGLFQLINEKSLKKVDKKLIALGIFYVVFAIVYLFFEKVIINYRPVLIDGKLEASYPSSHTLLAICLCGSSLVVSKYFIKKDSTRKIVNILTSLTMLVIVVGRIISGVHWISDIIGGIIISLWLLSLFYTSILAIDGENNFEKI